MFPRAFFPAAFFPAAFFPGAAPAEPCQPPGVPAELAVAASGQTSADVSWEAPTGDVVPTHYEVWRNGVLVGTVVHDPDLDPTEGVSYVGERGQLVAKLDGSEGLSPTISPTQDIPAGAILLLSLATDGRQASNNASSDHESVSDAQGNTWTKIAEFSRGGGIPVANTTSLWCCRLDTALATDDEISAEFSAGFLNAFGIFGNVATCMALSQFSGGDITVDGASGGQGNGFTSPELTIVDLSEAERLWYFAAGIQATIETGQTPDSDYEGLGSMATTGGGATDNILLVRQYRIATLTGDVSTYTLVRVGTGTSAQHWAGAFGALSVAAQNPRYTFADTTLAPCTQYCYQVRAVNACGPGPFTAQKCITTECPPDGPPPVEVPEPPPAGTDPLETRGDPIEIWDDLECAGGERLAIVHPPIEARIASQVDRAGESRIVFPRSADAAAYVEQERVVRFQDGLHGVQERRIVRIQDGWGEGRPNIEVIALDPSVDLSRALYRRTQIGSRTSTKVRFTELTPAQIINNYVLPTLAADGYSHFAIGTVEYDTVHNWDEPEMTAAQMMDRLAEETGGEWRARKNAATNYLLDLLEQVGGDADERLMMDGREVIGLDRTRERTANFGTVVIPTGMETSEGPATIGEAVWRVEAKTSTTVDVVDILGGTGPAAFDDQFNIPAGATHYLMASDGTLHEITDTEVVDSETTRFTLADTSAFAVGDDVEIRADENGTLLFELAHPTLSQGKPTGVGRIVKIWPEPTLRGERNYARNPGFRDGFPDAPGGIYHANAAAHSPPASALRHLKDLPAGLVIPGSSEDMVALFVSNQQGNSPRQIVTGGTVDSNGEVTIELDGGGVNFTATSEALIYILPGLPEGWEVTPVRGAFARFDRALAGTLTGAVDGAHASPVHRVTLTDLPADTKIGIGAQIKVGNLAPRMVLAEVTTDGSGEAVVEVERLSVLSGGEDVVITHPQVGEEGGTECPLIPVRAGAGWQSPSFFVRSRPDQPVGWLSVWGTIVCAQPTDIGTGIYSAPWAELDEVGGGTLALLSFAVNGTLPPGPTDFTLRIPYQLTSDKTMRAVFHGVRRTGTTGLFVGGPYTLLRAVMFHLGTDSDVPYIEGSGATKLHQRGNLALQFVTLGGRYFRVSARALEAEAGYVADDEIHQLGQDVRLYVADLDIDIDVRIVAIYIDPISLEVEYLIDAMPKELTALPQVIA